MGMISSRMRWAYKATYKFEYRDVFKIMNIFNESHCNSMGHDPLEKEIIMYGYHIVLTTHNSRTSYRMIKYKVPKGPPRNLNLKEEIILTEIIGDIIRENGYRCISYNICKDHVHLILVCQPEELVKIIQKLKSISSKLFNKHPEISNEETLQHSNRLWSQKFFRASFDEWTLSNISNMPGELFISSYLLKAMVYIENNREKHQLVESLELKKSINQFTITMEKAYS